MSEEVEKVVLDYVRGKLSLREMVDSLESMEKKERKATGKLMFLRFSNETQQTSIRELERNLQLPTHHPNHVYYKVRMDMLGGLNDKLEVFFA